MKKILRKMVVLAILIPMCLILTASAEIPQKEIPEYS